MTTETTTPGNAAGGIRIGMAPPPDAVKAAMAAFDDLGGDSGDDTTADDGEAQGASGGEPDEGGKVRRVEVDPKKLEADEAARKAKEAEDLKPASFKARRRQLRELETKEANVAAAERQLEGMRAELKGQLDKADQFDALEAELKASPAKVLKRYGIDLTQLNVAYMKEGEPGAEVKSVAQELAELKKQWAEEREAQKKAAAEREYETTVAGAVEQVAGHVENVADEFPAAAFFASKEPKKFKLLVREAIALVAKRQGSGQIYAEQVVKVLDDHYHELYDAIKPSLTAGASRPSTGPTTTAKLEKAPQSLGRAASTPVAAKDPDSWEERYRAALSELLSTH